MEPESPQTRGPDTANEPSSTAASAAADVPSAPTGVAAPPPRNKATRRSTLVIGSVTLLALGMLLGIGATQLVTSMPNALAATAKSKTHALPPLAASPAPTSQSPAAWNPFQELRDMQLHMDQMFEDMTTQFRLEPRLRLFADRPSYSLSLRVQDLKDHFEVRAYLPNAKASDVNVSLLDKRTLKVEVSNQTTLPSNTKDAHERAAEWGQYAQIIQLPAPVKSEEMKIDQPHHELLITLPKA